VNADASCVGAELTVSACGDLINEMFAHLYKGTSPQIPDLPAQKCPLR